MGWGCRRNRISTRNISVNPDSDPPPLRAGPSSMAPGVSPGRAEAPAPGSRRGRMLAEAAAVEEMPVWLEGNAAPAVTGKCTPDPPERLATGGRARGGGLETLETSWTLR